MRTITRRWYLSVAAVAILAATPAPTSSCEGSGGAPVKPKTPGLACDMGLAKGPWIYKRKGSADVEIRASVWVRCAKAPKAHHLEVWLERDTTDGGGWMLPAKGGEIARTERIPGLLGFDTTAAFPGCISGRWRVRAKATGVSPANIPFKFSLPDDESGAVRLTCPGPAK